MEKRCFVTKSGKIVYWVNEILPERRTLAFLPGLTADHRLFDRQIERFCGEFNVLVWDAPGHGESRPFELSFTLADKAQWLHEILSAEGISAPVLVGQSMGGYVSQMFMELFPGDASGFVSIDSAPLQRHYMSAWEIWMLKRVEPIYHMYPWKALMKSGSRGCACTEYGQRLMADMMAVYSGNPDYYCRLAGYGYRMLAEAIEADLPYHIACPAILICGEKDQAGSAKRYNRFWARETKLPLYMIPGAGHNSNTDKPEEINALILNFIKEL